MLCPGTVKYSTVQYSLQYSTVQYSTVKYITAAGCCALACHHNNCLTCEVLPGAVVVIVHDVEPVVGLGQRWQIVANLGKVQ